MRSIYCFPSVKEAANSGRPLRDVFADVGERLSRKPNSIRNFYYARVREMPELAARQTPFRAFTQEEVNALLRNVLIGPRPGRKRAGLRKPPGRRGSRGHAALSKQVPLHFEEPARNAYGGRRGGCAPRACPAPRM